MNFLLPLLLLLVSCGPLPNNHTEKEIPALLTEEDKFSSIEPLYVWLSEYKPENALVNRIPVPPQYVRTKEDTSSFATWLRHIPLKPGEPKVHLFNGELKGNQQVHEAVVEMDVGENDLQQCADAVMRLRAEYLLAMDSFDRISFNFTSGHACTFTQWAEGYRPVINGNDVKFVLKAHPEYSYMEFKSYMNTIFTYCGTHSLSQELKPKALEDIEIGDVFIHGGFPGHAVIVMDLAVHQDTGEKIFLLAQSYMPAQDVHILKNFNDNALSPWFSANFVGQLNTPEWIFQKNELMQF